jgi:uncharacterized membrane protein YjjP (DUF1212 family)
MKKQMIKDYKKLFQKLADGLISYDDYNKELKQLRKKYNTLQYIK